MCTFTTIRQPCGGGAFGSLSHDQHVARDDSRRDPREGRPAPVLGVSLERRWWCVEHVHCSRSGPRPNTRTHTHKNKKKQRWKNKAIFRIHPPMSLRGKTEHPNQPWKRDGEEHERCKHPRVGEQQGMTNGERDGVQENHELEDKLDNGG
mmetsp:Transcript_5493/g.33957  ORF Transcript_5493/g.33957 Transcript_5493/m.33957 type:complete len:150 (+) Transcript_5493:2545-2994(+)